MKTDSRTGHHSHEDIRIEQVHHTHGPSHMHIDPSVIVFFLPEDLKLGNTIPVYFPRRTLEASRMISKEQADSIPFSVKDLPNLLERFSFSPGSPQATAMKETLQECESKPIQGETKTCPTSYQSMIEFTHKILGPQAQIKVLSTTHLTNSNTFLQKYTVMGITQIPAPKSVACHTMPYAYTVFYCHYQESESKVFNVALSGENGDKVDAIAVCHMDTSQWGPNHVSFKVLGIEPGSSPVCHFFPSDNFVLVSST